MSLWGVEQTYGEGRYRVFAEHANTNAYSLPWDDKPQFAGYVNGVYKQGYTNGGRWVGASQGSGASVTALGWMDAGNMRMAKLQFGRIPTSMGAYTPAVSAPHGRMWGLSAQQTVLWKGMSLTPEFAYTNFAQGVDSSGSQRKNLRAGVVVAVGL
jgi:hypothetical protein